MFLFGIKNDAFLGVTDVCAYTVCIEPIVPDLKERLNELKRTKDKQDAKQAEELQEAQEKFDNMKELLTTENTLLR